MEPGKIRNIALVGSGGTGKTSMAEALLFAAGAISRIGRIESGNTVCDFEPDEIEKRQSLSMSLAHYDWKGCRINLLDTPGFPGFVGEARAALRAADLVLFVVSAVDGVEVQHELLWKMAEEEGIARAFLVNKLDRERANFTNVLAELKDKFGASVAPLHVPIGIEESFNGLVDLVAEQAHTYDRSSPEGVAGDVPGDMKDEEKLVHSSLVEAVVESDDAMLEAYLEGTEPTQEQLVKGFHAGIASRSTFPVLCASATQLVGVDLLSDFFVEYAPTPLERSGPSLQDGSELPIKADGEPVAYAFKTISDPYMGRVSLVRVFSGSIAHDADVHTNNGGGGRMHNVFYMRGKEHEDVKGTIVAGDIAAIAKVESIAAGDTISLDGKVAVEPVPLPTPVFGLAIFPKGQGDEEKLSGSLQKIIESDATLHYERNVDTHEGVLSGLSDTHLEVALGRLKRRYGVDVEARTPTVPYRESITGKADVEGRHKKQSGGRGQYGVARVRFEPATRGVGFEFVDAVVGGAIPRQFISAVEKGIIEGLQRGMVAGFPVVDVRATVYDGKFHAVDSDEMSFRMAGISAVKEASKKVQPALLEPIMKCKIRVLAEQMGDVIGDINSKRGKVLGMEFEGDSQVVTVMVPLALMHRYAIDLRQITGGRGTFEIEFDHYEAVPPQEAQKVIDANTKEHATV